MSGAVEWQAYIFQCHSALLKIYSKYIEYIGFAEELDWGRGEVVREGALQEDAKVWGQRQSCF